jgi:quinone-modifying oxidoreductase subunit QmoA
VCELERDNDFNYGMDKTKAVYMPHMMAFPMRYVVDEKFASDPSMKKCADACSYGAFDLTMKIRTITATVKALVWATGWRPYDATKLDNLAFGKAKNVITNVMMERLASPSGPTQGKISRPSDKKEISRIGFVQCAGSRDENHLAYCSAICCLASMKQATYIRKQYPDAEVHMFYIDVRSPGRFEDFYVKMQADEKFFFHRGKVGKITEDPATGNVVLEAENTLTGQLTKTEVEMAVLATGMVPNTADCPPPVDMLLDQFGFIVPDSDPGIIGTATAVRPCDVAASIQDATGAAMRALTVEARR